MKKYLILLLFPILLGAGIAAGVGLYDNVVLNSYLDFKTPATTPATSGAGTSRIYYDSTTNGLKVSTNAAATPTWLQAGRNKIINGNFNVWQRGTTLTTVTTGTAVYLADRWKLSTGTTGSINQSQTTNISGVNGSYNAILLQPSTTNTAGATSYVTYQQGIEGYNLIPLNNQVCTLSFWAKGTAGTYGIAFNDSTSSVSYVIDWVVPDTNMHQYAYTFTHSSGTGVWNYTSGLGMLVTFALVGGSTFQQTTGSWQSGNKVGSSAMTNTWTNSLSNTMIIAQVQLEAGPSATQFEQLDFSTEFVKCQRYYQKCFDYNTAPVQGTGGGIGNPVIAISNGANGIYNNVQFATEMRVVPTITYYGYAGNSTGQWRDSNNSATLSNATTFQVGTHGFTASDSGTSIAAGRWLIFWTAACEY